MTNKKKSCGRTAEKKKSQGFKATSLSKATELGVLLVSLLTIAIWFAAIFGVAMGLGWFLHMVQEQASWMPMWMFKVGHVLEGVLFVGDCLSLVFAVGKELWEHVHGHEESHHGEE